MLKTRPFEYKVCSLRPTAPEAISYKGDASAAVRYWREHIETEARFDPDVENAAVLLVNNRGEIIGHQFIGIGSNNSVLTAPPQVFRAAIVAGQSAVILMHSHPNGDEQPSSPDLQVTANMILASSIVGIQFLDHIVVAPTGHTSIQEYTRSKDLDPLGDVRDLQDKIGEELALIPAKEAANRAGVAHLFHLLRKLEA